MRARVYDGHRGRVVQLPEWVTLHVSPPLAADAPFIAYVECGRCKRTVWFSDGPRQEDERALGRFAVWHRRCRDPELVRVAVDAAAAEKERRASRYGGGASVVYVRRKKD